MRQPSHGCRTSPDCKTCGGVPWCDLPKAELHLLDTGHFALEDQDVEITRLMLDFLGRHIR